MWHFFLCLMPQISEAPKKLEQPLTDCRRQGMNNIARAWEIVEEVWLRDNAGDEADWRNICTERGFSIVFG